MQVRKHKHRKYAAPIGGLFVALALIGAATIVFFSIRLTGRVLDNSSTKTEIENIIRPMAMFDPVPFENPADIGQDRLLLYCMWSALLTKEDSSYSYDESSQLRVPASDLDVAAARLFGPDVTLEHRTFRDYVTDYYYDSEFGVYNIPVSATLDVYSPQVESVDRLEGDLYIARVGYIPPGNAWTINFSGDRGQPEAEKYMNYVLRKVKSGYQVAALRDEGAVSAMEEIPMAEIPTGDTPMGGTPTEDASMEDASTEDTSTEDTSAEAAGN